MDDDRDEKRDPCSGDAAEPMSESRRTTLLARISELTDRAEQLSRDIQAGLDHPEPGLTPTSPSNEDRAVWEADRLLRLATMNLPPD